MSIIEASPDVNNVYSFFLNTGTLDELHDLCDAMAPGDHLEGSPVRVYRKEGQQPAEDQVGWFQRQWYSYAKQRVYKIIKKCVGKEHAKEIMRTVLQESNGRLSFKSVMNNHRAMNGEELRDALESVYAKKLELLEALSLKDRYKHIELAAKPTLPPSSRWMLHGQCKHEFSAENLHFLQAVKTFTKHYYEFCNLAHDEGWTLRYVDQNNQLLDSDEIAAVAEQKKWRQWRGHYVDVDNNIVDDARIGSVLHEARKRDAQVLDDQPVHCSAQYFDSNDQIVDFAQTHNFPQVIQEKMASLRAEAKQIHGDFVAVRSAEEINIAGKERDRLAKFGFDTATPQVLATVYCKAHVAIATLIRTDTKNRLARRLVKPNEHAPDYSIDGLRELEFIDRMMGDDDYLWQFGKVVAAKNRHYISEVRFRIGCKCCGWKEWVLNPHKELRWYHLDYSRLGFGKWIRAKFGWTDSTRSANDAKQSVKGLLSRHLYKSLKHGDDDNADIDPMGTANTLAQKIMEPWRNNGWALQKSDVTRIVGIAKAWDQMYIATRQALLDGAEPPTSLDDLMESGDESAFRKPFTQFCAIQGSYRELSLLKLSHAIRSYQQEKTNQAQWQVGVLDDLTPLTNAALALREAAKEVSRSGIRLPNRYRRVLDGLQNIKLRNEEVDSELQKVWAHNDLLVHLDRDIDFLVNQTPGLLRSHRRPLQRAWEQFSNVVVPAARYKNEHPENAVVHGDGTLKLPGRNRNNKGKSKGPQQANNSIKANNGIQAIRAPKLDLEHGDNSHRFQQPNAQGRTVEEEATQSPNQQDPVDVQVQSGKVNDANVVHGDDENNHVDEEVDHDMEPKQPERNKKSVVTTANMSQSVSASPDVIRIIANTSHTDRDVAVSGRLVQNVSGDEEDNKLRRGDSIDSDVDLSMLPERDSQSIPGDDGWNEVSQQRDGELTRDDLPNELLQHPVVPTDNVGP